MFRTLTAAAALLALSTFALAPAQAQTAASAPARKVAAKKPAKAEPAPATNDDLNPNQLSLADRVLTGVADCEFKEKVDVEKIAGHSGNFKVTYEHKSYTMVPEETTTGAIRLVDLTGALVWIQIPMKSMLMNQKEHHRLVDGCQEDEQRIAVQASQKAAVNAGALAPGLAGRRGRGQRPGGREGGQRRRRRDCAPRIHGHHDQHHRRHHQDRAHGADEERRRAGDCRLGDVEVSCRIPRNENAARL